MTGVLIKRGNLDTQREGNVKRDRKVTINKLLARATNHLEGQGPRRDSH